jgi:soluble lytic murein transglycosylase
LTIESAWRSIPADYPIEIAPRPQLRLLYPAVFQDELLAYSTPRGIDARLLLAIMRQESRFQPDAKSNAAARGLMQFISTTSTRIAGELGRTRFAQDDLYQPDTAVVFGSQFVSDLFVLFPQQPEAVVAAYNGGDDNVKRWMSRSRSGLADRYVPETMYTQTKDYVYRVMSNYRMYRYLYDENLKPL